MSVELPLSHDELNVIRNRVRCSAESQYTVWWELLVREAQRAAVNAALERAAQLVIELTEDRGTADAIRALKTNKEQGNE